MNAFRWAQASAAPLVCAARKASRKRAWLFAHTLRCVTNCSTSPFRNCQQPLDHGNRSQLPRKWNHRDGVPFDSILPEW
jgi:hypothetical protein